MTRWTNFVTCMWAKWIFISTYGHMKDYNVYYKCKTIKYFNHILIKKKRNDLQTYMYSFLSYVNW